ncbi:MAG: PPOX class F420-dependent oxidoreductase [Acidimicrobiia bacterium]
MTTSLPSSHDDLLSAPGTAIFSTITPSGLIQSTAVWYLYDGGELKFSFSDARKKFRNLGANPTATAFILDPQNPFRFIEVRGTVTIEPDPDFAFRGKVAAHYGADMSGFDQPGDKRYVLTLEPSTVNAQ